MFRGMFRELPMSVEISESVTFVFGEPLSVTSLLVSNATDEAVWQITASEYEPVETEGGFSQVWPIDQAPPELLQALDQLGKRAEQKLAEHGPRKPPLASVAYGEVPPGYREEYAPTVLTRGEYQVIAFGEQGTARASFIVTMP